MIFYKILKSKLNRTSEKYENAYKEMISLIGMPYKAQSDLDLHLFSIHVSGQLQYCILPVWLREQLYLFIEV